MPHHSEDTYLFVDGEYLHQIYTDAMQSVFRDDGELDFSQVKRFANAQRVFIYDCVDDIRREGEDDSSYEARVKNQEDLFDRARSQYGIHVRLGSVRGKPKKLRQKEVDVLLAADMLTHGYDGNMRKATLIAGDLDFRPIVDALVRRGVFVEVWYEKKSGARELPMAADYGYELNFHNLYQWSSDSFRARCGLPQDHEGHGPVDDYELVAYSLDQGRKIGLFQDYGRPLVLRVEQPDRVLWFEHNDRDVLRRYCDVLFGPVKWLFKAERDRPPQ